MVAWQLLRITSSNLERESRTLLEPKALHDKGTRAAIELRLPESYTSQWEPCVSIEIVGLRSCIPWELGLAGEVAAIKTFSVQV